MARALRTATGPTLSHALPAEEERTVRRYGDHNRHDRTQEHEYARGWQRQPCGRQREQGRRWVGEWPIRVVELEHIICNEMTDGGVVDAEVSRTQAPNGRGDQEQDRKEDGKAEGVKPPFTRCRSRAPMRGVHIGWHERMAAGPRAPPRIMATPSWRSPPQLGPEPLEPRDAGRVPRSRCSNSPWAGSRLNDEELQAEARPPRLQISEGSAGVGGACLDLDDEAPPVRSCGTGTATRAEAPDVNRRWAPRTPPTVTLISSARPGRQRDPA